MSRELRPAGDRCRDGQAGRSQVRPTSHRVTGTELQVNQSLATGYGLGRDTLLR